MFCVFSELSWETEECTILDDEDCGAIPRVPEEDVLWCAEDGGQVISKASARQLGQPLERKGAAHSLWNGTVSASDHPNIVQPHYTSVQQKMMRDMPHL